LRAAVAGGYSAANPFAPAADYFRALAWSISASEGAAPAPNRPLTQGGLQPGPEQLPAGPAGPRTSWLTDPDGYRIELVQWPPGHRDGISADDFA
jgi:hypothetical protein